jgi:hypothetical protein
MVILLVYSPHLVMDTMAKSANGILRIFHRMLVPASRQWVRLEAKSLQSREVDRTIMNNRMDLTTHHLDPSTDQLLIHVQVLKAALQRGPNPTFFGPTPLVPLAQLAPVLLVDQLIPQDLVHILEIPQH